MTQRQLDNVWLWQDVNIGPHGRYLFNVPVPSVPAHWTVSAFGVSPTVGYGVLPSAVEVSYMSNAFSELRIIFVVCLVCGSSTILHYCGDA